MTDDYSEEPSVDAPIFSQSAFDLILWQTRGCTPFLILTLVIAAMIGVSKFYRPLFQPVIDIDTSANLGDFNHPGFSFRPRQLDGPFYYVDKPPGWETYDIFTLTISGTDKIVLNLTNSPEFSELSPVLSPTDDRIAFFAVSRNGDHSLRVLQPGHGVLDATYTGVISQLGNGCRIDLASPPQWGPGGLWIAFLGQCGDEDNETVQLFVTRADGTEVRAVTKTVNRVTSVGWLDNQTLIFGEQGADGFGAIERISLADPRSEPDILKVVNVPKQN